MEGFILIELFIQIKTATINTANIKTNATAQQIRQLTLQQHLLAQHQRKLNAQKLTSIGQVMVSGVERCYVEIYTLEIFLKLTNRCCR